MPVLGSGYDGSLFYAAWLATNYALSCIYLIFIVFSSNY